MALNALTIAGGGLAGLSLGIALRQRDVPVTLHEAARYPRHRVCGEFISGVSPAALESLGIHDLFEAAVTHRESAWYHGDRQMVRHTLPVPAIGISRHQLDDALQRRFTSLGGELVPNSRLTCEVKEGLIWCGGRRPARSQWMGLKCHLKDCSLEADLEMHLGHGAYVGLARVEDGQVNLCGLFPTRKSENGTEILAVSLREAGLARLADRVAKSQTVSGSSSAVAGFSLGWQDIPDDLFALGDSLAMIPPFTGNGMSMAFESAEAAVEPLAAYSAGRSGWGECWRETRRVLGRRFSRRLAAARALHPFLTSSPGQALFATFAGVLPFRSIFYLLR